jgi:hypothetical protein
LHKKKKLSNFDVKFLTMNKELADEVRERLLEIDPCIEFDDQNHDKLIGYAERFGCHFIPLYLGVNTFIVRDPEEAERLANQASSTPVFPMPQMNIGIIGYVTFDDKASLLYDKEKYLEDLAKQYEEDGMEIDEEYESYYSNAVEWYEFNDLGYGLSDSVTPAFAVTEEFSIEL